MDSVAWRQSWALLPALALVVAGCGQGADNFRATRGSTEQPRPSAPVASVSVVPVGTPAADPSGAPYAWINGPYVTRVGKAVELDGSGSYARDGVLVSYEWDFDGDGVYDERLASATVVHRWSAEFSGLLRLRVTDSEGRQQVATTHLSVSGDGDEVPTAEDNCPEVANPGQDDEDHDGVGDQCDRTPGWPTQDAPGVSEGTG